MPAQCRHKVSRKNFTKQRYIQKIRLQWQANATGPCCGDKDSSIDCRAIWPAFFISWQFGVNNSRYNTSGRSIVSRALMTADWERTLVM